MALVAKEISADQVLISLRESMGLSASIGQVIDDPLLGGVVRRVAGFLCPCARSTLARAVVNSFELLHVDLEQLRARADEAIELLVVNGDLLELDRVTTLDEDVRRTWIFAAPPAFTKRPSGAYLILGLAPDETSPLPADLAERLMYQGLLRVLRPLPQEKMTARLRALGFSEISEQAWLAAPKAEIATAYVERLNQKLEQAGSSGAIPDLLVLDGTRPPGVYRARWTSAGKLSGRFVARRPQAYGADLWIYVELDNGLPKRFVDLPPLRSRFRGCDWGWRLQLALDRCRKAPQHYRRREAGTDVVLDFSGPIPSWAQRRLLALGKPEKPEKALFACRIPKDEAEAMEKFLLDYLWLERAAA